jgi:hypothetical protein
MFTVHASLADTFLMVREKIFDEKYSMMNGIVKSDLVLKTFSDPSLVSTAFEPKSNRLSPMDKLQELHPFQIVGESQLSPLQECLHIVVITSESTEPPQKRLRIEKAKGDSEVCSRRYDMFDILVQVLPMCFKICSTFARRLGVILFQTSLCVFPPVTTHWMEI